MSGYQVLALVVVVLGGSAAVVLAVLYALRDIEPSDMGGEE